MDCCDYCPFVVLVKAPDPHLIWSQANSDHTIRKLADLRLIFDSTQMHEISQLEVREILRSLLPEFQRGNLDPCSITVKSLERHKITSVWSKAIGNYLSLCCVIILSNEISRFRLKLLTKLILAFKVDELHPGTVSHQQGWVNCF